MNIEALTVADVAVLDAWRRGDVSTLTMLPILEKAYGPVGDKPAATFGPMVNDLLHAIYTPPAAVNQAMWQHVWAGGPQPWVYLELQLCRLYHCLPDELARQQWTTIRDHLSCIRIETKAQQQWQKQRQKR